MVSPYNDISVLPIEVVCLNLNKRINFFIQTIFDTILINVDLFYLKINYLKKGLKKTQHLFGDGLSRLFLRAIIMMIGSYRQALVFNRLTGENKITFNDQAFVQSRGASMQPWLEKMLHLQLFRQFIENRLEKLNAGLSCDDCFDLELNNYSNDDHKSTNFKLQYQQWLSSVNKTMNPIKSINQPVRSVYKNIKDKSRKTYKEFCVKINDNLNKKSNSLVQSNQLFSSNTDLNNSLYRQFSMMPDNNFDKFYNET